jgi:hypothetical protein
MGRAPKSPRYAQQQQTPNVSLPMYSNQLGRLPIYGQFQFSDSVPSMPVQSSDSFVDLVSGPMGASYNMQGMYTTNPSFEGQVFDHIQGTPSDFAAGDGFNMDILSSFGAPSPIDDATMAMWSAAPTNFECVFSLLSFVTI